jgi:hypothetical protein
MLHTQQFQLGPRLASTSWHLHRTRRGQWALSETRFYEDEDRVFQMPQPAQVDWTPDGAIARVPATAKVVDTRDGIPVAWVQ